MANSSETARSFLDSFFTGEYAKATETFDATMRAGVTDQMLSALATQIQAAYGKPVKALGARAAKTMGGTADIVYLSWQFEKDKVDARLVVNSANQVAGLSFETPVAK